jgi:fumarate reductase (CoM/CoB) subunit A
VVVGLSIAIVETDVLVIGSGVAGLCAAIEAKQRGSQVTVVSKSPIGFNSCSSYSMGALRVAINGVSHEQHFNATMNGGKFLNNPKLVETMVKEAPSQIARLQHLGIRFQISSGRCTCSGPPLRYGEGLTQPLARTAINSGVKAIGNTTILELIKTHDSITGAIGINTAGTLTLYRAKAVVLTCGGAGRLYTRTDNPVGSTGDGYTLALNAGAELIDMEFIQFFPMGLAEPGLPTYLLLLNFGVIKNAKGTPFLQQMGLNLATALRETRDLTTRAIYQEIRAGRGDGECVLLDLTQVPDTVLQHSSWFQENATKLLRDFPYRKKPIHIAPLVHHFMGGIRINERTESSVKGLFAAGEVTGGIHGANRMGGNALTDAIVFGFIAGKSSSSYANSMKRIEENEEALANWQNRITDLFENQGSSSPSTVKSELQHIMWTHIGVGRTAESIQEGLKQLRILRETRSKNLHANDSRKVKEAIEVMNMIDLGRVIGSSALKRTETRGAHYRLDYPEQKKTWHSNIVITMNQNGTVSYRKSR